MKKKIIVTGCCGYVGTELCKLLIKNDYEVLGIDTCWYGNSLKENNNFKLLKLDIRNIEDISFLGYEAVVHLANIANDPAVELKPDLSWEVNVLSSKLLIEKSIKDKVSKFIYASSGSVYGLKDELNVTEELSLVPISVYNKTKMISERVLLSYVDKININILRPATVCGYSDKMRLDLSVNMLTFQALKNKKINVFGGSQIRPNVHILDMINAYLFFLKEDVSENIFNIGFENISILDIAKKIKSKVDTVINITDSNDPRSYRLNSDKIMSIGFKKNYDIDFAIDELIQSYNEGKIKESDDFYAIKKLRKLVENGKVY